MNRYEREKPGTGGARAAVNRYWNTQKTEEERRRYLHAMWQNYTWYEVWRALFHNVSKAQAFSWAESHERLRRYVQALKDRH